MKPMKKQSFLQGAGILAIATIVVKLIGALYKIPLNNIIGKEGYAYFLQSYDIYALLLTISTAGLPVAVSKLVSEANALNRRSQVRRTFRVALLLMNGVQSRLEEKHSPAAFRGLPISLLAASIIAMVLVAFK